MTRTLTSLGDRMLGAVLKQKKAGACVPPDYCGVVACTSRSGYCSGGWWWQPMCNGYYNCTGTCKGTGGLQYNKKVAYGC
ncbi:hypothetical protein OG535_05970 [Kitasatospora sp. NBC_00085]|uniref:hypothetical protein n=1 Tax=unclassified Kitasatospora TaxID=2633591 RepID=UPI0032475EF7